MKARRAAIALPILVIYLFFPGKAVQFILAFILLAFLLSFAYSRVLKDGLTAGRIAHDLRTARFDSLELLITLENRSFLPACSCYLSDSSGLLSVAEEDGRWICFLAPHELVNLRYAVRGNERGEYSIGPLHIAACDPLGLFPFEKVIEDRCAILVRPANVSFPLSFGSGIPQGRITVRDLRYEDVTLFRSVRDYAAGDEQKRINWKSSARFGKLFTNEYQDTLNCPVFVFLDLSVGDYPVHSRYSLVESLVEIAAALVTQATVRRQQCGFASTGIVNGSGANPFIRAGQSQSACILDILAKIALSDGKNGDGDLLSRSLAFAPSGSRFFHVGPIPPETPAGGSVRFRRLSEYVHETV